MCVWGKAFTAITVIHLPINERFHPNDHEQAETLLEIHKQVHDNIVKANEKYHHKGFLTKGRIN